MHMEPGIVDGMKIVLSYATASACALYAAKLSLGHVRREGMTSLQLRSVIAAALMFVFFAVFPHMPVGVSEAHPILGAAPTAIGLSAGLALQGLFFTPQNLPQYGMYVTTLLAVLAGAKALRGLPVSRAKCSRRRGCTAQPDRSASRQCIPCR